MQRRPARVQRHRSLASHRRSIWHVGNGTKETSQTGRSWVLVRRTRGRDLLYPSLDSAALEGSVGSGVAWARAEKAQEGFMRFPRSRLFFKARLSTAAKRLFFKNNVIRCTFCGKPLSYTFCQGW